MGASAQRGLPLLFPLYALLSLLRDVAVAAALLAWHSALLAPRVAWHALRGGRGAASPADPGCEFYEGTVTHTRLLPVLHAFSYPVRLRHASKSAFWAALTRTSRRVARRCATCWLTWTRRPPGSRAKRRAPRCSMLHPPLCVSRRLARAAGLPERVGGARAGGHGRPGAAADVRAQLRL